MKFKIQKNINWKTTIWFGLVVFILDRILKSVALEGRIFFYKNYGLAFSIPLPSNYILYFNILIFLILIILIYFLIKFIIQDNKVLMISFCLLVVGTASNLLDRLKFGWVIDYFNFGVGYNNLADIFIVLGLIILVFYLVIPRRNDEGSRLKFCKL